MIFSRTVMIAFYIPINTIEVEIVTLRLFGILSDGNHKKNATYKM